MLRTLFGVVALCVALSTATAADKNDNKNAKNGKQATITKVDPKAKTVTVRMKGKDGKDVERTFKLTEDVRYFDSTGKVAVLDVFRSGDMVLIVEEEGRIKEVRQNKGGSNPNPKNK